VRDRQDARRRVRAGIEQQKPVAIQFFHKAPGGRGRAHAPHSSLGERALRQP
jgi:hypothetical protein